MSLWRNKENYAEDLLKNNLSATGIHENLVWNTLSMFHVVENYAVDVMHDLLEGVCHYDMAHVLRRLIECKWFDLPTLNERILKYISESTSKNKIGLITDKIR